MDRPLICTLRLAILVLVGMGHVLLTLSAPAQPLDVTALTDEELIELQYRDDAKAELDRRIDALPFPAREEARRWRHHYVPARDFPDDFQDDELIEIYLSQPGMDAEEIIMRALITRTAQYNTQEFVEHRTDLMNRTEEVAYPDHKDTSVEAEYQRAVYLSVARVIVCTTPEEFAIPLVREMTLGRNIERGAFHLVGLLVGVQDPGPATIALAEELYEDMRSYGRRLLYEHPGELQTRIYGILSRCGPAGMASLQKLGSWETSARGLGAMASFEDDSARDLLIELYERRKAEEDYANPDVLVALVGRLYHGPDPVIRDLLREEIPPMLRIPADEEYGIRSFAPAISIAGKSKDPFFLPLLRDFRNLVEDGTALRSAREYASDRAGWELWRGNLLKELDGAIRSLERHGAGQ